MPPLSNVPVPAVTVAVNVTLWPYTDGFGDEATVVVVARLVDRLATAQRAAAGAEVRVAAVAGRDRVRAAAQRRIRNRGTAPAQAHRRTVVTPVHRELHRAAVVERPRTGRHRRRERHALAKRRRV